MPSGFANDINRGTRALQGYWRQGRYLSDVWRVTLGSRLRLPLAPTARQRLAHVVSAALPVILVTQVQRSGGTLTSRLFDGHPECFAHPYEIHWTRADKSTWPVFDVSAGAAAAFAIRDERWSADAVRRGNLTKGRNTDSHPFIFDRQLLYRIFKDRYFDSKPITSRAILDSYFTAFFNAWLDFQQLYSSPKRFVTGFTPRINATAEARAGFWRDYPDGYIVSIVREPVSWFASASRHSSRKYGAPEMAIEEWTRSTRGTLALKREHPGRVLIVLFEDLVRNPETAMRQVCAMTGLSFHPCLLTPTFNGRPVLSDSSFTPTQGLDLTAVDRASEVPPAAVAEIQLKCGELHQQASEESRRQRFSPVISGKPDA